MTPEEQVVAVAEAIVRIESLIVRCESKAAEVRQQFNRPE